MCVMDAVCTCVDDLALSDRYSSQSIVQRHFSHARDLVRLQSVINWLENLFVKQINIELIKSGHTSTGYFHLKHTLRKLQRSNAAFHVQQPFLDPDVSLRHVKSGSGDSQYIESGDVDEEERLLEYIWQLMRAGRLKDAIELCRVYQQHWRAASLSGGEVYHDEGHMSADGCVSGVGNPTRFLWKHSCRALSEGSSSKIEAAIYGVLSNHLSKALLYYKSYHDVLWIYLKVLMEQQVDALLIREMPSVADAKYYSPPTLMSIQQVFANLSSNDNQYVSTHIHAQSIRNPYHRLQRLLILTDITHPSQQQLLTIEEEIIRTLTRNFTTLCDKFNTFRLGLHLPINTHGIGRQDEDDHISSSYLSFIIHVYLYLYPTLPQQPLTHNGIFIFTIYILYLISMKQYELVAPYCVYLPSAVRIKLYVEFLAQLDHMDVRKKYLTAAKQHFPHDVQAITKLLVSGIVNYDGALEEEQHVPLTHAALLAPPTSTMWGGASALMPLPSTDMSPSASTQHISSVDQEKINSIGCFEFNEQDVSQHHTIVLHHQTVLALLLLS